MPIRHTKTVTIPDWTQADLDAEIALGNYPPGTTLADIFLSSDFNANHTNPDIADVTGLQTALDAKVAANSAITGATKTKITYDAKGLVTAGADATTADIADSTNRRYLTDAQLAVVANTSGVNTGDQTNISGNAGTVSTINGRIAAGTNVTLGGAGTAADPYVINATSGGGSGDVVGPASATDNTLPRYDGTTGKLIQGSGVAVDDSNNVSGIGTLAAGATTLTSNAAQALAVGANGGTNPAFQVNASAASAATGVGIVAAAAGGGVVLEAISSGADESLTIRSKGSSDLIVNATGSALRLQRGGTNQIILTSASATYANTQQHLFTTTSLATAASVRFSYVSPTETNLTAGTEAPLAFFNLAASRTHASNTAITLQRDFRIAGTSHAFATAGGTITDLAALALTPGTGGANTTITNNSSLLVQAAAMANTTNGYGINITAPTGATNNFAARFAGAAGEIFRLRTDGQVALLATNTAAGTTGAQTINRPSGTVNFAAGATSLVVTNSLCTTSSLVFATIRTNDATAVIKNVVPAAGSFTINLNAAATAETSVGFFIIN